MPGSRCTWRNPSTWARSSRRWRRWGVREATPAWSSARCAHVAGGATMPTRGRGSAVLAAGVALDPGRQVERFDDARVGELGRLVDPFDGVGAGRVEEAHA